jgi:hypothetical protein
MGQLDTLKMLVTAESDLARFTGNDNLLNYALSWASDEILKRREADTLEDQYLGNQIEGAKWYLSRMGTEGADSISENGEQTVYSKVPGWLLSVIPRMRGVRDA